MDRQPCVYMLASRRNGTPYIGVTSRPIARIHEHRSNAVDGFTRRYGVHALVWYELHPDMPSAIAREKALKAWRRAWKLALIERTNPQWRDLYPDLLG
ncbi:GIY-YIG nuclease family protein [Coralloluteibacterium stylophorae]|uniref:GIY-YIG nuclease family protein n=1 Tax=Coralloluteibacterium stylophorae TaxID=1776034 RepID=A0A8J7VUN7_9GAMM|nr:GIY-YIG nuclease family protein [Coralloluteibacterium stylophorae]MBS7457731.1 GIY-YIG nuclease family protein [Coralloluteibacterium stylophorae]